jgi:integrase
MNVPNYLAVLNVLPTWAKEAYQELRLTLDASENTMAMELTGRLTEGTSTYQDARHLEDLLLAKLVQLTPLKSVKAQFLLLDWMVQQFNQVGGSLYPTRIALPIESQPSPFRPSEMDNAATAANWRSALLIWNKTGRVHDTKSLAAAATLSAVLYGMILSPQILKMWVARLNQPVEVINGFAFTDFQLNFKGQEDAHLHRWWLDPSSEFLFSRVAASKIPVFKNDKELIASIADVLKTGRYKGEPPSSLSEITKCAAAMWMTEASRAHVLFAQGKLRSHSLRKDVWLRMMNCELPKLQIPPSTSDPIDLTDPSINVGEEDLFGSWYYTTTGILDAKDDLLSERLSKISALLTSQQESSSAQLYLMWLNFMLTNASSSGKPIKLVTASKYFKSTAASFLSTIGDTRPDEIDPEDLARIFENLINEDANLVDKDNLRRGLREFQHFLHKKFGKPSFSSVMSILGQDIGFRSVDANILSEEEYQLTHDWLQDYVLNGKSDRFIKAAKIIFTIFYRIGARRMEVLSLRICDLHLLGQADILIRPYDTHDLKTINAKRRIPLHIFLTDKELQAINNWHMLRIRESGGDLDSGFLLFTDKDGNPLSPDALTDLITKAMRTVTNDSLVHPHLLRHSFGSLSDLSQRGVDAQRAFNLFKSLSLTHARLLQGTKLRSDLTGAKIGPVRSCGHALARLLGHSNCGTSWECYCHFHDLLRYGICMEVIPRYTPTEFSNITGLPKSTTSEILSQTGDISALLLAVRKRYKEKFIIAIPIAPEKPRPGRPKKKGLPLPLDVVRVILSRDQNGENSIDSIADDLPCNSEQVSKVLKLSKVHLTNLDRLFPSHNHSKPMNLGNSKEKDFARLLEIELDNLARKNSSLLKKGCNLFIKNFNYTKNDVVFYGEKDLKNAIIFLKFLKALGFDEMSLCFILRSENTEQTVKKWWCEKLNLTATAKFITIKPHDSSKPESSNSWLGFQLIDVKHNEPRLIVAARVMLLCTISIGINH